jgi:hypothetical protein
MQLNERRYSHHLEALISQVGELRSDSRTSPKKPDIAFHIVEEAILTGV